MPHRAAIVIPFTALHAALGLPASVTIVRLNDAAEFHDEMYLVLEGPGLPEVHEGDFVPILPLEEIVQP